MGKRQRASSPQERGLSGLLQHQEIFLRILSFLPCADLARVQSVDRYWASMSLDPQLWKRLYLGRYPHPHHTQLIPHRSKAESRMRPIKRMPSRAFPPPSPSRAPSPSTKDSDEGEGWGVRHDGVDWKQMLKVGLNWANGNASLQSISPSSSLASTTTRQRKDDEGPYSPHIIALAPTFILTAHTSCPLLHIYPSPSSSASASSKGTALGVIPPPPTWSSPRHPDAITAVAVDQSIAVNEPASSARVAVFYASGGLAVLHLTLDDAKQLIWRRIAVFPAARRRRGSADRVVLAQYHHPVILSCTLAFRVSVYSLATSEIKLLQSLQSQVSFHPATLSLLPLDTPGAGPGPHYHGALTYSTPLYPRSWTVAVQELFVDLGAGAVRRGECWHVGRSTTAAGTGASARGWPRRSGALTSSVIGVTGERAVGVGTDGRWCVLAGEDNQIQVYALPSGTEAITHCQTLLAHSAAVTSISLSAGRCVSGGNDGRVLVWELDGADAEAEAQFVEVRSSGRQRSEDPSEAVGMGAFQGLPQRQSISHAARALFLSEPPADERERPAIQQLAFDEQKIVGLVRPGGMERDEVMRVWSFAR